VIERFGPPEVVARWWNEIYQREYGGGKMWQRFTERARRVVFFAQEEAARLGKNNVDTGHLLLGLVRESDNVAARILEQRLGIPLSRIRQEAESQLTRGGGTPGADMHLTPRAKRMIDLAYEEARSLSNNYIGTEHLLLGLIREEDDWAQGEQAGATPGQGVLEILPDGWGFLRRRADLAPSSDDIYVSQSQIQRFALKAGDRVSGKVRPPQERDKYYGLLRIETKNEEDLASAYFDDRGGGVLIQLGATLDRTRREVQAMQEVEKTLLQRVKEQFLQAVERGTNFPPEVRALIEVLTLQDAGRLADAITPYLTLKPEEQQALQGTKTHTDRLEKLSELLNTRMVRLEKPKPGSATSRETERHSDPPGAGGDQESSDDARIARLAQTILQQAVKEHAAAIQIERGANSVLVRHEIDGVLHEKMKYPLVVHESLVARYKRMAGMDPEERSLPQVGHMTLSLEGQDFELDLRTEPTPAGEIVAIRLRSRG
jgi:hypothetical protein